MHNRKKKLQNLPIKKRLEDISIEKTLAVLPTEYQLQDLPIDCVDKIIEFLLPERHAFLSLFGEEFNLFSLFPKKVLFKESRYFNKQKLFATIAHTLNFNRLQEELEREKQQERKNQKLSVLNRCYDFFCCCSTKKNKPSSLKEKYSNIFSSNTRFSKFQSQENNFFGRRNQTTVFFQNIGLLLSSILSVYNFLKLFNNTLGYEARTRFFQSVEDEIKKRNYSPEMLTEQTIDDIQQYMFGWLSQNERFAVNQFERNVSNTYFLLPILALLVLSRLRDYVAHYCGSCTQDTRKVNKHVELFAQELKIIRNYLAEGKHAEEFLEWFNEALSETNHQTLPIKKETINTFIEPEFLTKLFAYLNKNYTVNVGLKLKK